MSENNSIDLQDLNADLQHKAIRDIENAATDLHRELTGIQKDATRALKNMEQGLSISGMSNGVGPLGHQAPFDVTKYTVQLANALGYAQALGCSQDDITTAYTRGA